MRKLILLLVITSFTLQFNAQTFSVTDPGNAGTNSGTDCASISVTGLPAAGGAIALSQICVNVTSNYDANLNIYVDPPGAGGVFTLSSGNGSSGDNYSNTCFSPLATQSVEGAAAPFNGTYVPEGCLWSENLTATNGTWQVCVQGYGSGSVHDLTSASLTFTNSAGIGYLEAADLCANATPICADDGFNGSTSSCYNAESTSPLCGGMSIENSSWLKFVASSTSVVMNVTVGNCYYGDGIQFVLYTTTNCSSFSYAGGTSANCYYQIYPGTTPITFTNLTVGQTYYWMIDGFAGDDCDFVVDVVSGVLVSGISSSNGNSFCLGQSTTLSVNGSGNPPTGYTWSEGGTTLGTSSTVTVTPTTAGTHTYSVDVLGACGPISTLTYSINVLNSATPTFTARPPICAGASMTALPTTSNNGISGTWSPALNNTTTTTYTFTPSAGQCASTTTMTITVNQNPTISLTSAASTTSQTVCQNTAISNITYSVGGSATGASVSGLPAGVTGNYSGGTYTISGTPTATGTFNYTVTTSGGSCGTATATGSIVVNSTPTVTVPSSGEVCVNSTLSLSPSSGGTWSSSNTSVATITNGGVVTGVSAGSANMVFTNTTTGCSSTAASGAITVNGLPTINTSGIVLNDPTTCGGTDGSITGITASGTATLTYSWNSTPAQTSVNLNSVGAGSYTLTVTDGNSCQATAGAYSLSDPSSPPAPTISLTPGAVCVGGSATISINSPDPSATYTWSGPSGYTNTGTSITISPLTTANSGSYDVSTSVGGCTTGNATAPVNLTVNSLPFVDITTPIDISCANPVITLDGSNSDQTNSSFSWIASSGGAIIGSGNTDTETTSTVGDYELTVLNTVTQCSNSLTVSVSDNFATPAASVSVPNSGQIDCNNPTLSLDGSGSTNSTGGSTGITYTWSTTSGGSSIGSSSSYSASTAGDYYLLVTETSSGCTDEMMVTVTENTTVPVAIVTDNNPLSCDSLTILVNGGTSTPLGNVSYEWEDSTPGSPIGTNSTVSISTPGNYSLLVTDISNGCQNTANFTVTQDITPPTALVTTPVVVNCYNPLGYLNGIASSQGPNITYLWTTSTGLIIGDTDLDTAATITAGTYNLLVENTTNGCTANANVTVTVDNTPPSADAGLDVNFPCGVTTVQLDGSATTGTGLNYSWFGPGVITAGNTSTPNVNTTGTFMLVALGSNGCRDTSYVDVIPNITLPNADAGTDVTVTCLDLPVNVVLDGSGSDSGMNYQWATIIGNIVSGSTTLNPVVDQAAGYQLTVTDPGNNCFNRDTVYVIMDTIAPIALAGNDTTITCNTGLVVDLDASGSTGTNLTYSWSTSNGIIDSQTNSIATVSGQGDYTVTATGDNGCTASDDVSVVVDTISPLVVIATPLDLDCAGTPVTLDGSGSSGVNETYLWSDNTNSNTTSVTTAGIYTLTVTNDNGCITTSSVTVNNATGPTADFTATPVSGNIPLQVVFTNNSTGSNLTNGWDFGNGTTSSVLDTTMTYTESGDYTVILVVTDDNSCTDTASILISADGISDLIIPNIFSPNGDLDNDVFTLQGSNISEINGTIFNRWGQIVYEFNSLGAGWDGYTISGTQASAGTYYYIITAVGEDGQEYEFQGPLELIR
ncbi:MAG: gliding motility-associated C-terminal domain-containing protein [Flavobacteriales bacterium]|nr:gliding motility-associated C-terminal domain-containing protein [Flavobacteriales bacterium]